MLTESLFGSRYVCAVSMFEVVASQLQGRVCGFRGAQGFRDILPVVTEHMENQMVHEREGVHALGYLK